MLVTYWLTDFLCTQKNLWNAWITTSDLRDTVTKKRHRLQLLRQKLKLASILKGEVRSVVFLRIVLNPTGTFGNLCLGWHYSCLVQTCLDWPYIWSPPHILSTLVKCCEPFSMENHFQLRIIGCIFWYFEEEVENIVPSFTGSGCKNRAFILSKILFYNTEFIGSKILATRNSPLGTAGPK